MAIRDRSLLLATSARVSATGSEQNSTLRPISVVVNSGKMMSTNYPVMLFHKSFLKPVFFNTVTVLK